MTRRRNYFIKRRFQANFFLKFVGLLFLEAVLIGLLFMYISRGTLTTAYEGTGLTIQKTGMYFFMDFVLITVFTGAAIAFAGSFVFMYLTHRIGGPLYKFEQILLKAVGGDIAQRIQLRKDDQLKELGEEINSFLSDMDSRVSAIENNAEKAIELMGKSPADIAGAKKIIGEIKDSLKHFKTSARR